MIGLYSSSSSVTSSLLTDCANLISGYQKGKIMKKIEICLVDIASQPTVNTIVES